MSKRDSEVEDARKSLLQVLKPGDTIFTSLAHCSRSGMQRVIQLHVFRGDKRNPDHLVLGYNAAILLGRRYDRDKEGVVMGGCGMDMGFALVHEVSDALFGYGGKGYKCLGEGKKCPSNYHTNYRSTVRCEGFDGRECFKPSGFSRGDAFEGWPRGPERTIEVEGQEPYTYQGALLAVLLVDGDIPQAPPYEVCPTCKGEGELPNPEGPERFDLVHKDGYALSHRWL